MELHKEIIKLTPELLDRLHQSEQEILDAFVHVCENNNLRYYLFYGTLLGAVRHQGPIPWDDDLDVAMPRSDIERFKQIMLSRPEGERFHIHCGENDRSCAHLVPRLNKRGTVFRTSLMDEIGAENAELCIDIFPLDNIPDNKKWRYRLIGWYMDWVHKCVYNKGSTLCRYMRWKGKMLHLLLRPVPYSWLLRHWQRLMCRWNDEECKYYASWQGWYHFEHGVFAQDWFEPAAELVYQGKIYRVPGQPEKCLKTIYGDYMRLPAEDKRGGHCAVEIQL